MVCNASYSLRAGDLPFEVSAKLKTVVVFMHSLWGAQPGQTLAHTAKLLSAFFGLWSGLQCYGLGVLCCRGKNSSNVLVLAKRVDDEIALITNVRR